MVCRGWSSLAVLVCLTVGLLVLAACGSSSSGASTSVGDRLSITFGALENLPLTEAEALASGWNADEECEPNMGKHLARIAADSTDPSVVVAAGIFPLNPLILIVDSSGDVIGFELLSLNQQPSPPWEHFPDGRPRIGDEHWILHVFLSDPTNACS